MYAFIAEISAEKWTLFLSAINTIIILVGVPFAIANLRVITKTHHLESVSKFLDDLASTEADRHFLFRNFTFDEAVPELSSDTEEKVKRVVNSLNRIGLLLENKMLSPELVFSISHTVIIRCWHKLQPYLAHQEKTVGGRYGRRLKRLAHRAMLFHDSRPHQRIHPIMIYGDQKQEIIYQTKIEGGWKGFFRWCMWEIKFRLHIY